MDVSVPLPQFIHQSTQTDHVIIFDAFVDPTKRVIAEEKHLSKLSAFKCKKEKIESKKKEFVQTSMKSREENISNNVQNISLPVTNSAQLCILDSPGSKKTCIMPRDDDPYVPQFTSSKTEEDFKRLSLTPEYSSPPTPGNYDDSLIDTDNEQSN